MSISPTRLHQTLTTLASLVGLLALGGGVQSLINPQSFGETTYGIPTTSAAHPFASLAGARNLNAGVTTLTLLYLGQRKAVGVALMCGVATGFVDAWISVKYNAAQGKAVGHAVMGTVIGCLGVAMYRNA